MITAALSNSGNPIITALALGLGCGVVCSPVISLFLTTYTMGNFQGVKKGFLAFSYFLAGKAVVMLGLTFISALVGKALISRTGVVGGWDLHWVLDLSMIITGFILILRRVWASKSAKGCPGCGEACGSHALAKFNPKLPVFVVGAAYALTPCAPLLTILFFASLMSPMKALLLGAVFCIASSVSPLFFLTALAGFFSQKMHQEIPRLVQTFQWNCCVLLILMGGISLVTHLVK